MQYYIMKKSNMVSKFMIQNCIIKLPKELLLLSFISFHLLRHDQMFTGRKDESHKRGCSLAYFTGILI